VIIYCSTTTVSSDLWLREAEQLLRAFARYLFNINMDFFTENSDMYKIITRISSNLHLPLSDLTLFQKGRHYLGIRVYNSLPSNDRLK
jgi:hypothetical protein